MRLMNSLVLIMGPRGQSCITSPVAAALGRLHNAKNSPCEAPMKELFEMASLIVEAAAVLLLLIGLTPWSHNQHKTIHKASEARATRSSQATGPRSVSTDFRRI